MGDGSELEGRGQAKGVVDLVVKGTPSSVETLLDLGS
jgi:hypothetical protein